MRTYQAHTQKFCARDTYEHKSFSTSPWPAGGQGGARGQLGHPPGLPCATAIQAKTKGFQVQTLKHKLTLSTSEKLPVNTSRSTPVLLVHDNARINNDRIICVLSLDVLSWMFWVFSLNLLSLRLVFGLFWFLNCLSVYSSFTRVLPPTGKPAPSRPTSCTPWTPRTCS